MINETIQTNISEETIISQLVVGAKGDKGDSATKILFDPADYGAIGDGEHPIEDTTAIDLMLDDMEEYGGGTVVIHRHFQYGMRPDGTKKAFVNRNNGDLENPRDMPIRFVGTGWLWSGQWQNHDLKGGILELLYDGSNDPEYGWSHNALMNFYGNGAWEVSTVTLLADDSNDLPFIFTSFGSYFIDKATAYEDSTRYGEECARDFLMAGYGGLDGVFGLSNKANFQGYGGSMTNCFGHRIRSFIRYGNDCNGTYACNNTMSKVSGSNDLEYGAVYRFLAGDGHGCSGNTIIAGTNEIKNFKYLASFGLPVKTHDNPSPYLPTAELQTCTGDYTVTNWVTLDAIYLMIGKGVVDSEHPYGEYPIEEDFDINLMSTTGNAGKILRIRRFDSGYGATPTPHGRCTLVPYNGQSITWLDRTDTNLQGDLLDMQSREIALMVNPSGTGWIQVEAGTAEYQYNEIISPGLYDDDGHTVGVAYYANNAVNNMIYLKFASSNVSAYNVIDNRVFGAISGEGRNGNSIFSYNGYHPTILRNKTRLDHILGRVLETTIDEDPNGRNFDLKLGTGSNAFNVYSGSNRFYTGDGDPSGEIELMRINMSRSRGAEISKDVTFLDNLSYKTITGKIASVTPDVSSDDYTVDWTTYMVRKIIINDNFNLIFTNPPGPCTLRLMIQQGTGGNKTVTFPENCKFPAGVEPVLSTSEDDLDILTLFYDGSIYYVTIIKDWA